IFYKRKNTREKSQTNHGTDAFYHYWHTEQFYLFIMVSSITIQRRAKGCDTIKSQEVLSSSSAQTTYLWPCWINSVCLRAPLQRKQSCNHFNHMRGSSSCSS